MTRAFILLSLTFGSLIASTLMLNSLKPVHALDAGANSIAAHRSVPPEVSAILARSCGDCHSSSTRWPWYTHLPGIEQITHHNADRGRKEFNLSNWSAKIAQGSDEEIGTLNGMCEEVRSRTMPLPAYLLLHPSARLKPSDVDILCKWSESAVAVASTSPVHHP